MNLRIYVNGIPKGQPRPRGFAMQNKKTGKASVRMYDPGTAEGWKSQVAEAFRDSLPETPFMGPVEVTLAFVMPRPKNQYRTGKHSDELRPDAPTLYVKTPDADNLAKAVLDALTTLGLWGDDAQVVDLHITRRWAGIDKRSGCLVLIEEIHEKEEGMLI